MLIEFSFIAISLLHQNNYRMCKILVNTNNNYNNNTTDLFDQHGNHAFKE